MIKAELSYNPYLLETGIKFNGQTPRINSQVEKYQGKNLPVWVKQVPQIFCDEMNGYGFELEFSGTVLDLELVKAAFEQAGVNEDSVPIFHKNELDSRTVKIKEICDFLILKGKEEESCFLSFIHLFKYL